MAPHNTYKCSGDDKWIAIAVADEKEWHALCRVMGHPAWANDAKFADQFGRWKNRDEIDAHLREWTRGHDHRELAATLQQAGVPAGPVLDSVEIHEDRHLWEWGYWWKMNHHEVGERIRAHPGDRSRGALTVFTDLYWECVEHFRVRAGSFHPRPAVDAEVLVMTPRVPPLFALGEESLVLETIRAVFSAPRKAVRNAVGDRLGIGPASAAIALERCGIDPMARASTLETGALIILARTLAASFPEAYADEARDA